VGSVEALDSTLQARAGVLTGEAAVTLGAEGQGMVAGDLVNTASRIQSQAQPGTVLAGDATKRASEAAVAYADEGEHELKGKVENVHLWRALRVVSNRGGEGRTSALEAPFVGRDRELRLAKELFHASAEDGRATLLTVVGVAGIGKSRLAWELEKHLDGLAELVWWHRGRCLAYGEGVAFWALAEMIRMRARIAEDEPVPSALAKLAAAVEQHVPDHGEREWVEPLLRHLLGLGERPQIERADLFSAWRLFFERMSDTAPVALVFEDLHWADTALLDFVEHLLEWSRARPIFVLALTRPELLERRGDFGSHSRNSTTMALEPLTDEAMDALLDGMVPGLPAEVREQIRERADGIPLYAVETVRMLLDRGALAREGDMLRVVAPLERLDVPETLHALIAARLDGLDPEERRAVQHAAVLGKTFGAAGIAALEEVDVDTVVPVLDRLVRKELLAIELDPRSPERGQYGFLQALVQHVAHETLARKERGRLHRAAAAYLEHEAGLDPDEIAEVIAAHHRDAYEADPMAPEAEASRRAAGAWLERAGERAALLGAPDDGLRAYDEAAAIAEEPLDRGRLLEQAGRLAFQADRMLDAESRLRTAVETFGAAGDPLAAARAASSLGLALWQLDRSDEALETLRPAFEALADGERSVEVGRLAAEIARIEFFAGERERARDHIELAIDIAEECADLALVSHALNTKSLIIRASRPHERHALLRESLRIAEEHDLTDPMLRAINNLIVLTDELDRPDERDELNERGIAIARARGHRHYVTWFGAGLVAHRLLAGAWDEAFALAGDVLPDEGFGSANVLGAFLWLAQASFERDDDVAVRDWLARIPADLAESIDVTNAGLGTSREAFEAFLDGRVSDGIDATDRTWRRFGSVQNWRFAVGASHGGSTARSCAATRSQQRRSPISTTRSHPLRSHVRCASRAAAPALTAPQPPATSTRRPTRSPRRSPPPAASVAPGPWQRCSPTTASGSSRAVAATMRHRCSSRRARSSSGWAPGAGSIASQRRGRPQRPRRGASRLAPRYASFSRTIWLTWEPSARPATCGITSAMTRPRSAMLVAPTSAITSSTISSISSSESGSGMNSSRISSSRSSESACSSRPPERNASAASSRRLRSRWSTCSSSSSVSGRCSSFWEPLSALRIRRNASRRSASRARIASFSSSSISAMRLMPSSRSILRSARASAGGRSSALPHALH
jgi:predicted ATPase